MTVISVGKLVITKTVNDFSGGVGWGEECPAFFPQCWPEKKKKKTAPQAPRRAREELQEAQHAYRHNHRRP